MKGFDAEAKHDMQEQRKGVRAREPDKGMVQSTLRRGKAGKGGPPRSSTNLNQLHYRHQFKICIIRRDFLRVA